MLTSLGSENQLKIDLNHCFDVIVAGGGPSGLFASYHLSKKGYSIALFDKESSIGENIVCSGVIK
ncbi:MAG: NAD(P)-binding protein [Candidatus Dadabacteria bacterium]|nr:NAD(P)-binding protein [Candidatus Dadabacteria bacterium]NIQ14146.1 NAD(P)-binding protein [Candidatus Dadabacteria bacterium]